MIDIADSSSKLEQAVLDSYFQTREPVRNELVCPLSERKTTEQIQDDLNPVLRISDTVIVDYMLRHDFQLVPEEDGSLVWQMYRMR